MFKIHLSSHIDILEYLCKSLHNFGFKARYERNFTRTKRLGDFVLFIISPIDSTLSNNIEHLNLLDIFDLNIHSISYTSIKTNYFAMLH